MTVGQMITALMGLPVNAKVILEVMDSNGEPYSADVTRVFPNELGQLVITDEVLWED